MVPCASVKLVLGAGMKLEDFDAERDELTGRLEVRGEWMKGRRSG